jgi:hypothetical protein
MALAAPEVYIYIPRAENKINSLRQEKGERRKTFPLFAR